MQYFFKTRQILHPEFTKIYHNMNLDGRFFFLVFLHFPLIDAIIEFSLYSLAFIFLTISLAVSLIMFHKALEIRETKRLDRKCSPRLKKFSKMTVTLQEIMAIKKMHIKETNSSSKGGFLKKT